MPCQWRNKPPSNVALVLCTVVFAWLAATQVSDAVTGVL